MSNIWQGPTKANEKICEYYFRFGGQPPKRKFFGTFLTSIKLHLVDQISSEGRTEGLITFPQVWGAY